MIIYEPNCYIVGPNYLYFILWGAAGDLPKMKRNKKIKKKKINEKRMWATTTDICFSNIVNR